MKPATLFTMAALVFFWAVDVAAQCTKDTDCKGNRICVQGKCQQSELPLTPASPVAPQAVAPADPGWAHGAGVYGFVSAGIVFAMAIGIDIARPDPDLGMAIGGAATLVIAASGPVVGLGGSSAREHPGVYGSPTVRLMGWIGYGLALADAMILLVLGADDAYVPPGVVTSVGLLGASGISLLAFDAIESARQARGKGANLADQRSIGGVQLVPMISAVRLQGGQTGTVVGLVGRF